MLEGLDTIDWTEVHQAFGDGTHLPAAIRDLTSPEPEVREAAVERIDNYVVVQGALSEAAAVIVPFLTEIVAEAGAHGKSETLDLLFQIARGYLRVSADSDGAWAARVGVDLAEEARLAEAEYRDTRLALTKGIGVYCNALAEADPDVRLGAAYLLAQLPEAVDVAEEPMLAACDRELDPDRRAVLIQCFGELFDGRRVGAERLARRMSHPLNELDRTAAAAALGLVMRDEAPQEAVEALVHAMGASWPPRPPGPTAALNVSFPLPALRALGIPRGIDALVRCLDRSRNRCEAHWITEALLALSFGEGGYRIHSDQLRSPKPRIEYRKTAGDAARIEPLSDLQRRALTAVLQCDKLWEIDSNLLEMFGLPADRAELRRRLAAK